MQYKIKINEFGPPNLIHACSCNLDELRCNWAGIYLDLRIERIIRSFIYRALVYPQFKLELPILTTHFIRNTMVIRNFEPGATVRASENFIVQLRVTAVSVYLFSAACRMVSFLNKSELILIYNSLMIRKDIDARKKRNNIVFFKNRLKRLKSMKCSCLVFLILLPVGISQDKKR